ncbi:MAG: hypothetical protein HY023_03650 [Chloroflexi bacterium]|nr:hypothetical protein [Chloroflexota bacterium]
MSTRGLHTLVGRAVISDDFCTGMLNGRRAQLIREMDLEPDETDQVMAIRADSLPEFAAAVQEIILARDPWPAPAWLDLQEAQASRLFARPLR